MGFIRNLPHTLVTSFRATLEEVAQAEAAAHPGTPLPPTAKNKSPRSRRFSANWTALDKPRIEVLNKIDLLGEHERQGLKSRPQNGGEVAVSARTGEGMEALLAAIDQVLHSDPVIEAELRVPPAGGALSLFRHRTPEWSCIPAPTKATWCVSP